MDYIKILRRQHENASLVDGKCQMLAEQNRLLNERIRVSRNDWLITGEHDGFCLGIREAVCIQRCSTPVSREEFLGHCCAPVERRQAGTVVVVLVVE